MLLTAFWICLNSLGLVSLGTNCRLSSILTQLEWVGDPSATHCWENNTQLNIKLKYRTHQIRSRIDLIRLQLYFHVIILVEKSAVIISFTFTNWGALFEDRNLNIKGMLVNSTDNILKTRSSRTDEVQKSIFRKYGVSLHTFRYVCRN